MSAPKQPQDTNQDKTVEVEQSETQIQEEGVFVDADDETIAFPQESNLAMPLSEAQAKVA